MNIFELRVFLFLFLFWSNNVNAACLPENVSSGFRFPIVVNPSQSLIGARTDRLVAWSFKNNNWRKVVLQVDEKNSDGNFVLDDGIPYTKGTDDRLLDSNDEISFRGQDLGSFFSKNNISKEISDLYSKMVSLSVCVSGKYAGSILIGISRQEVPLPRYQAIFNSKNQTVSTTSYHYKFNRKKPMLVGEVFLKSGGIEHPVFSDSTFVMPIIPDFWLFPGIKFDESDFESEIECWKAGPVRSIVAVGAKMAKFFSIVKLHLFSELVFYDDFFQIPTHIEMIFNANDYLDFGSGLAYILRFPKGGEWTLKSNLVSLPLIKDIAVQENGVLKVSAYDHSPKGIFRAWGTKAEGSFLAQVRVDRKALHDVPPPFIIEIDQFKDLNLQKSWGWLKQNQGNLGVFLDISRVKKGVYDFALDLMLSHRANDDFNDFSSIDWDWSDLR